MYRPPAWAALILGTLFTVPAVVLARQGIDTSWLKLAFANGILLVLMGLALLLRDPHSRPGIRHDRRNRLVGVVLAISLSLLWRAGLGVTWGAGSGAFAWTSAAALTLALLLPAMLCWLYAFATLIPWSDRHPALGSVRPNSPGPQPGQLPANPELRRSA